MRKWIVLAVGLALAFAAVFAVIRARPAMARTLRLRDGSVLHLNLVTFGTSHSPDNRPKWVTQWGRFMPASLEDALGYVSGSCTMSHGNNTNLMVWTTISRGNPPNWVMGFPAIEMELDDGHGNVVTGNQGSSCGTTGAKTIFGTVFENFPRRDPTLTLRVRDAVGTLGEFVIANPAKGPFAEWKPQPLPQRVTNGDIMFRLESVARRELTNWTPPSIQYVPTITAMKAGVADPAWVLDSVFYADATGNTGWNRVCETESAWKLTTTWFRNPESPHADDELIRLPSVPVPAPGQRVPYATTGIVHGVEFRIEGIAAAATYTWSNNVLTHVSTNVPSGNGSSTSSDGRSRTERFDRSMPHLYMTVSNLPAGDRLMIRGRDDRGRPVGSNRGSEYKGWITVDLKIPPGAKTLDLELIPQSQRVAEFHFDPKLAHR